MILRPYQVDLVDRVRDAMRTERAVVMQLGTGGGKTATAATILRSVAERGRRAVFLAHLDTLITDTAARLSSAGIHAGVVQAGRSADEGAPVQVASIATLLARGDRPPADLVILDECHRAMAVGVRSILDSYPAARVLGLTATPQRGDGQPLGDVFGALVCGPTNRELIACGALVHTHVLAPPAMVSERVIPEDVALQLERLGGERAIVFCDDVAEAEAVAACLRSRAIPCAVVTGDTPREDRELARQRLVSGDLRAIVGVSVFLEGWDCPAVDTVVLARGFSVTGSFLQACGRGMRPAPGKTSCTVLDMRGSVYGHGLPDEDRAWSLSGTAVSRTEKLDAVMRCTACLALYRPAAACPRCGAAREAAERIKRKRSRVERLEAVSALHPAERDARYVAKLTHVALTRMRMPWARAAAWANTQFRNRFGRDPEVQR